MRRAIILIVVMTALSVGFGLWADFSQRALAHRYLDDTARLRALVEAGELERARNEQAYLHALWERDVKQLNFLISHHHTRAVTSAMLELTTALEHDWKDEAIRALDKLGDALEDVAVGDFPCWENIL